MLDRYGSSNWKRKDKAVVYLFSLLILVTLDNFFSSSLVVPAADDHQGDLTDLKSTDSQCHSSEQPLSSCSPSGWPASSPSRKAGGRVLGFLVGAEAANWNEEVEAAAKQLQQEQRDWLDSLNRVFGSGDGDEQSFADGGTDSTGNDDTGTHGVITEAEKLMDDAWTSWHSWTRRDTCTCTGCGSCTGACVCEINGCTLTNCTFSFCVVHGGVPNACITPSPTMSRTPSTSATPTLSITSSTSLSPTITPTISVTPSITPSSTPTRSITPTNTPTRTITPSLSLSSSQTRSNRPSSTPTCTRSFSSSITPTISLTPTQTPTPSVTPSNTPTPSITGSQTPTNTPTRTLTPTSTETPTVTPTRSLSSSETPSNTQTPSGSPTESFSNSPSFSPMTLSSTPSSSSSRTPSITPSLSQLVCSCTCCGCNPSLGDCSCSVQNNGTACVSPAALCGWGCTYGCTAGICPTTSPSASITTSITPTNTRTGSPSSSFTPTNTRTASSSVTPSSSVTMTPSITPSPSRTPSSSLMPSSSSTPSVTVTPPVTVTPTVTPSRSSSVTVSLSSSRIPSSSRTPFSSFTPSQSRKPSTSQPIPLCNGRSCDDGNLCTIDSCSQEGICSHTPLPCFTSDICAEARCNPSTGRCETTPAINCDPVDSVECSRHADCGSCILSTTAQCGWVGCQSDKGPSLSGNLTLLNINNDTNTLALISQSSLKFLLYPATTTTSSLRSERNNNQSFVEFRMGDSYFSFIESEELAFLVAGSSSISGQCLPADLPGDVVRSRYGDDCSLRTRVEECNLVENLLSEQVVSITVSAGASAGAGGCTCAMLLIAVLFYRRKKKKKPDDVTSAVNNARLSTMEAQTFSASDIFTTEDVDNVNPLFEH